MDKGIASWGMGTALERMITFVLLLVAPLITISAPVCPEPSAIDSVMMGLSYTCSPLDSGSRWASPGRFLLITEVGEIKVSLQKVLNLTERNNNTYAAILFHASWCPFSKLSMPTFVHLSSLFPTVHHVAVEESAIRPSLLSKYGIHGFPTFILQNSTIRAHYRGPRKLVSLHGLYRYISPTIMHMLLVYKPCMVVFIGIKPSTPDLTAETLTELLNPTKMLKDAEKESRPSSWVWSPEKLLEQESYLMLATSFLVLRLICILLPRLLIATKMFWRRYMQHTGVTLNREGLWAVHILVSYLCCIPKLCKGSILRQRSVNARAWASKSLASISISEG